MATQTQANGSCLCGAVELQVAHMTPRVGACHCSMCRKWGGGPLLAVDCHSQVEVIGEQNVSRFDSSEWAERGFCNKCGSHLFYRLKLSGQYIVPAGILDIEANVHFDHQVFIDEKPKYYEFANKTKNMTGQEVFEMFAGGSS